MIPLYERLREPGAQWFEAAGDDALHGDSLLFTDPLAVLPLRAGDDLDAWFSGLDAWLSRGCCLAGWLGYEAALALDPALASCGWPCDDDRLLGWFAAYRKPERPGAAAVAAADRAAAAGRHVVGELSFDFDHASYVDRVERIRQEIAAGNVYQVNFTGRFRFAYEGAPESLYVAMKRRQPSSWSAFLNMGDRVVLSFSPELFFRIVGGRIETMPMKGTARRGRDEAEDLAARERLAACPKNRAENLMIVDLLRNDLGRVCRPGTIVTSGLFEIRSWPTLHQMVSTVQGELRPGVGLYDLFRAVFPSGSVTGAPKVRAMKLIRSLEQAPRGVYTGAIGFMLPDGHMSFSVAIRTLELAGGSGIYGAGGGIVWDSEPDGEYRECFLKARILADQVAERKGVFETMLWNGAVLLQGDHLDRMAFSAGALGFPFDRSAAEELLCSLSADLSCRGVRCCRLRLLLAPDGALSLSTDVFSPDSPGTLVRACIAEEPVYSRDPSLHHKLAVRTMYDRALQAAAARGCQEALFLNERGEVTEGAISNVLVLVGGRWHTPPESCGLLNGVFRRYLLRTRPWIAERPVTLEDLRHAERVLFCNALRGCRDARIVF